MVKTSLKIDYRNIPVFSGIDISSLKPVGDVPDFSTGGNYFKRFGIKQKFWEDVIIPALMRKYNNQCCVCGSDRFLEVHHKDYEDQSINNLFLVCKSCHTEIHNSQLDNSDFIEAYNEGLTDSQIALKLNVTESSVFRRRHKLI